MAVKCPESSPSALNPEGIVIGVEFYMLKALLMSILYKSDFFLISILYL